MPEALLDLPVSSLSIASGSILIIDDEPGIRDSLETLLTKKIFNI